MGGQSLPLPGLAAQVGVPPPPELVGTVEHDVPWSPPFPRPWPLSPVWEFPALELWPQLPQPWSPPLAGVGDSGVVMAPPGRLLGSASAADAASPGVATAAVSSAAVMILCIVILSAGLRERSGCAGYRRVAAGRCSAEWAIDAPAP